MTKQTQTYESALEELQQVVEALRNEMISIDEITNKVNRAKELINFCKDKLRAVEAEI